jgi:hypothetical protein
MKALKELEQLVHNRKLKDNPRMPEHAVPKTKFRDTNTNGLTQAILACFKVHDMFATRIDSKGTFNQKLKRFIPSNQKKGLPDVFAQAPGLPPIWIEVKCQATNDRLKPHQEQTIEELRKSGAIVYVAGNFQDFYEWFKSKILKGVVTGQDSIKSQEPDGLGKRVAGDHIFNHMNTKL